MSEGQIAGDLSSNPYLGLKHIGSVTISQLQVPIKKEMKPYRELSKPYLNRTNSWELNSAQSYVWNWIKERERKKEFMFWEGKFGLVGWVA